MKQRPYNIFFHTHTISGIIICALVYVIFFAGSLSFFREEISAWHQGISYEQHKEVKYPYQQVLDSLDEEYGLAGRSIIFYLYDNSLRSGVSLGPSKDTLAEKATESTYFNYNYAAKKAKSYEEAYDLGEFLYRLHFLTQFNAIPSFWGQPFGYSLAGLVSFLFLFALITGLLVHWDKLISNFFLFRPWAKLKTLWTDLHTVLGVISYPFQLVFAFTGIILICNIAFIAPFNRLLYEGDSNQPYHDMGYTVELEAEYQGKPLQKVPSVAGYVAKTQQRWPGAFIKQVKIVNYGDEGMRMALQADADFKRSFSGTGVAVYDFNKGTLLYEKSPYEGSSYTDKLRSLIYRLHLGDFGGYFLKAVYFILGIMGCLVTVSGILIWLVARDKKAIPEHKRKFNHWLATIYLAICLSMFPVTSFSFILLKMNPGFSGKTAVYQVYLYSWLALSIYYIIRNNISRTNRETLLLGAVLSICIPIVNGIYGGYWLWESYAEGAMDILAVDLLWIFIAIVAYISYWKVKGKRLENIRLKPR